MIVMVCVDENNGMMFHDRRQSRDKAVLEHIEKDCKGSSLYMNAYSYKLFADRNVEHVVVEAGFLAQAGRGDYCFVEDESVLPYGDKIEKLILYKWNRTYPADLHFDIILENGWHLWKTEEFKGTSHEMITKEIYLNEKND